MSRLEHDIAQNSTITEALRSLEKAGKLTYASLSDDWVITFKDSGRTHFIHGFAFDLNSQASSGMARDKVATYQLLADAGIPALEHYLLTYQAPAIPDPTLLSNLFKQYASMVIKPTLGGGGRNVVKCDTADGARALIQHTDIASWAASPFLDIRSEVRFVVYDGAIPLAYEKQNPPTINGLRMFNLGLGAAARRLDSSSIEPGVGKLVRSAMEAIGLKLGAVDVIFPANSEPQVLEINSAFSLEHYAGISQRNRQEVVGFYQRVIADILQLQC